MTTADWRGWSTPGGDGIGHTALEPMPSTGRAAEAAPLLLPGDTWARKSAAERVAGGCDAESDVAWMVVVDLEL